MTALCRCRRLAAMARLVLHPLPGSKRAGELTRLLDELWRAGRRVVVWVQDEGRRQVLDDYLWTFSKLAFLPHSLWTPSMGEVADPIVLVGDTANPNRAEVLVVGDELPPGAWAATFEEIHDLVPADEEGAPRQAAWQRWREEFPQEVDP